MIKRLSNTLFKNSRLTVLRNTQAKDSTFSSKVGTITKYISYLNKIARDLLNFLNVWFSINFFWNNVDNLIILIIFKNKYSAFSIFFVIFNPFMSGVTKKLNDVTSFYRVCANYCNKFSLEWFGAGGIWNERGDTLDTKEVKTWRDWGWIVRPCLEP